MDTREMHVLFRVLGQQMGLERVRGILPESIDVYLNDACVELAMNTVKSNVQTVFNDKVTIQNNSVSVINGVSTLYRENTTESTAHSGDTIDVYIEDVMFFTGFSLSADMVNYHTCRIIESEKLETTLDDYCSRASLKYPIISLVSADESEGKYTFRIYGDKADFGYYLRSKYIKMPNKIQYVDGNITNDKQCDLPAHLHKDVVELAVTKYFSSVGSTSQPVRQ